MFQTIRIMIMIVFFSLILAITGCTKEDFMQHNKIPNLPVFEKITDKVAEELIKSVDVENFNFFSVVVVDNNNGKPALFSRENRDITQNPPPTSVKGINNITSISIARVEVKDRSSCQYINLNGNSQVICKKSQPESYSSTKPRKGDIPEAAAKIFASEGRKPDNKRKVTNVVLIDPDSGETKLLKNQEYEVIQVQPSDFKKLEDNTTTITNIHYANSPGCAWTNVNGREVFNCTRI